MRSKLDSYLGFARKSGSLISGTDTCLHGLNRGKLRLLILTEDLADGTMEKLQRTAEAKKVECRVYGTMESLSAVLGVGLRGVFGITDKRFADIIRKEIDGMSADIEGGRSFNDDKNP